VGGALTVLGGLVGWLVGPQVVALLFGADYRPGQMVAALVAAGVMAASTTQVAGQALVASGATGTLAGAWVGGLVAALAVLFVASDGPDTIVAIAFFVGELTATVVVAVRILGGRRQRMEPARQL
jgi:O-antigen/teichoic acid export membrane protein